YKSAEDAFNVGFLGKSKPDLSNIFDLNILNKVLKEKGLTPINSTTNSTGVTEISQQIVK
ncbi:MAG TPA: hypothetical protein VIY98_13720, partial [Nitrososphaeraceae archaeon]